MNSLKNCVVGVWVNGKLRGTGYVVTREMILTCAHVLTDSQDPPTSDVEVQFYCDKSKASADVSNEWWSSSSELDIAVLIPKLGTDQPLPVGIEFARLGRSEGRRNRECELFGFPEVADVDGLGGRATVMEEIRTLDGRQLFQLESRQVTSGYSGAPLFDCTTGEVIGTAVEIATQARARYANHLHARLDDLAFAIPMEVIQSVVPDLPLGSKQDEDEHEKARGRVRLGIFKILAKQRDATAHLAKGIPEVARLREEEQCERVTDYLLNCSLDEFIPLVLRGFAAHVHAHSDVALAFRELATYVLPQIYQADFLQEVRRRLNRRENFLQIPASHRSIVELVVAGALGTKLRFDGDWQFEGDIPSGKLQIPTNPELGIISGDSITRFCNAFERAIMQKVGGLPRAMKGEGAQTRAINRALETRAKGEPPIRYYYLYGDGQSRVEELERRYPYVVFIFLEATEFKNEEFDILDCLKEMFCPKDL